MRRAVFVACALAGAVAVSPLHADEATEEIALLYRDEALGWLRLGRADLAEAAARKSLMTCTAPKCSKQLRAELERDYGLMALGVGAYGAALWHFGYAKELDPGAVLRPSAGAPTISAWNAAVPVKAAASPFIAPWKTMAGAPPVLVPEAPPVVAAPSPKVSDAAACVDGLQTACDAECLRGSYAACVDASPNVQTASIKKAAIGSIPQYLATCEARTHDLGKAWLSPEQVGVSLHACEGAKELLEDAIVDAVGTADPAYGELVAKMKAACRCAAAK